jgi:hypothetical protein
MPATYFLSGHLDLTEDEFEEHYRSRLDAAIDEGARFVVGDARGCDSMVQAFLATRVAVDRVRVFHMFVAPRFNLGKFTTVAGFTKDDERDQAMTAVSTADIAWVRPGREQSGTARNIQRRLQLPSPGTRELAYLDQNHDLLRICSASSVSWAIDELRAKRSTLGRSVLLSGWKIAYRSAFAQLMIVIARDADTALELAPAVLATDVLDDDQVDDILVAAFPRLTGAYREAAADRDDVRRVLGITTPILVGPPDPSWLWPSGKPFPPADTIAGVQARLNYLEIGAGLVDGEWSDRTRRAFARWQVLSGLEPTGEVDYETPWEITFRTPDAPEWVPV